MPTDRALDKETIQEKDIAENLSQPKEPFLKMGQETCSQIENCLRVEDIEKLEQYRFRKKQLILKYKKLSEWLLGTYVAYPKNETEQFKFYQYMERALENFLYCAMPSTDSNEKKESATDEFMKWGVGHHVKIESLIYIQNIHIEKLKFINEIEKLSMTSLKNEWVENFTKEFINDLKRNSHSVIHRYLGNIRNFHIEFYPYDFYASRNHFGMGVKESNVNWPISEYQEKIVNKGIEMNNYFQIESEYRFNSSQKAGSYPYIRNDFFEDAIKSFSDNDFKFELSEQGYDNHTIKRVLEGGSKEYIKNAILNFLLGQTAVGHTKIESIIINLD